MTSKTKITAVSNAPQPGNILIGAHPTDHSDVVQGLAVEEAVQTKQILVNKDHVYQVGEEFLPSVTTILSAVAKGKGFNTWLQTHTPEESDEILTQAGLSGSKCHHAIERMISGQRVVPEEFVYTDDDGIEHKGFTPEESRKLTSFVRWWFEYRPKVLAFEKIVYSESRKYAGTVDFIGQIKVGTLIANKAIKACETTMAPDEYAMLVLDWKTNKSGIYATNIMQAAAYAMAEMEMTGKKVNMIGILRLGTKHKAGYEFKVLPSILEPYKAFLGVVESWRYQNPEFGPRIIEVPLYFQLPKIEQVQIKEIKKRATATAEPAKEQNDADTRDQQHTPDERLGNNKAGDERPAGPA